MFHFIRKAEPVEEDAGTTHPASLAEVEEEIFDLGKPLTCLMIRCRGCSKIDPVEGCTAYEDPSKLIWFRQDHFCPHNPPYVAPKKKKKRNPLKASKQAAKQG